MKLYSKSEPEEKHLFCAKLHVIYRFKYERRSGIAPLNSRVAYKKIGLIVFDMYPTRLDPYAKGYRLFLP